jgi:hypothetical protein
MTQRIAAPHVISTTLAVAAIVSAASLLFDPEPFAWGAALLIAIGLLAYGLISIAGILLVRAPWARWLGLGTVVGGIVVITITGFESVLAVAALVLSLIAVAGLAGSWLTAWLRQRAGTGPEPRAAALPLVAIGAAPLAGLAAWSGLTPAIIAAATVGPIAAWGYAASWRWGLWSLRIVYPVTAVAAAATVVLAGSIALVAHAVVVGMLAWSTAASRAQLATGTAIPVPRFRRRTS